MNFKRKKKKGSSLLMVIMIFSITTILGVSVMSLTASAYKKRIVEGTAKQNRYFAEAGLDIAYGIIGKVVDGAINDNFISDSTPNIVVDSAGMVEFDEDATIKVECNGIGGGNDAVKQYMNLLNGGGNTLGVLQREKDKLKSGESSDYIDPSIDRMKRWKSYYVDDSGRVRVDNIKKIQEKIFKSVYKSYVTLYIKDFVQYGIKQKDDYGKYIDDGAREDAYTIKEGVRPVVTVSNAANSTLDLKLQSTFTDKNMKKIIALNYNIGTPKYKGNYVISNNVVGVRTNVVLNKAVSIKGDLVNGDLISNGTFNTDGNVHCANIDDMVNFTSDKFNDISTTLSGDEIYLNNSGKNCAIIGTNANNIPVDMDQIGNATAEDVKGIIVTSGNVYLYGKVNFTGIIISKGNLVVEDDNSTKTITYDPTYVKGLIAYNNNKFIDHINQANNVFKNTTSDSQNIEAGSSVSYDTNSGNGIRGDKLIKMNGWKILK